MNPWNQPQHPEGYGPPPQQPANPGQYGYQPTPLPQYPGQPGSNTLSSPSSSGATAIAAAVLALLGCAAQGLGGIGVFAELSDISSADWDKARDVLPGWTRPYLMTAGVVAIAVAVALLVGGILLLRRRDGARMLIATSCVIVMVAAIAGLFFALDLKNTLDEHGYTGLVSMGSQLPAAIGGIVFPLVTLILVLMPSTKRWCAARQSGAQSMPDAYPPYR
jgi:hypothetical protein